MKTEDQTKVNSAPSDAVASMVRLLTSSDGNTGGAVKTKKGDMRSRTVFWFRGLKIDIAQPSLP